MPSTKNSDDKKKEKQTLTPPKLLTPGTKQDDSSSTDRGKSKPIDSELEYKHHMERMEGEGGPVISSQDHNGHDLTSALEKALKDRSNTTSK